MTSFTMDATPSEHSGGCRWSAASPRWPTTSRRSEFFLSVITEKVDGFLHQDARRRVVRVLIRHRGLFFGHPPILSRSQLPSLVGTSREMTGRVLRQLEREGMVARVGRHGLRLLRPDRLDADESLHEGPGSLS